MVIGLTSVSVIMSHVERVQAQAEPAEAHEPAAWQADPPEPEPAPESAPPTEPVRRAAKPKPRPTPSPKPTPTAPAGPAMPIAPTAPAVPAPSKPTPNVPAAVKPTKPARATPSAAPENAAGAGEAANPAHETGTVEGAGPAGVEAGAEPGLAPPPPPVNTGDFAGRGTGREQSAEEPQEDFDPEVQEERRPEKDHEYSVRFDALNWFLSGRLSIELEMSLLKYLSVTLTPVFVTGESPISVNYAGLDNPLTQHSNGLGPLSGVSVGVGAWLWGEPFRGYVLRLELTNYGYSYRTADSAGTIDRVDFTERRLSLFIGSHSRFGPFTFAGGFGLGYELNQAERCGLSVSDGAVSARESGCKGHQYIALDRTTQERADLNGPLHPVYFQARFSLGVVF